MPLWLSGSGRASEAPSSWKDGEMVTESLWKAFLVKEILCKGVLEWKLTVMQSRLPECLHQRPHFLEHGLWERILFVGERLGQSTEVDLSVADSHVFGSS